MESFRILGCSKECSGNSSSESGWTAYIASTIKENHHHHHDDNDDDDHCIDKHADYKKRNHSKDNDGTESDDSMASDASSGPCHNEFPCKSKERSVSIGPSKHATTICSPREKPHRQVKQREGVRPKIRAEIEESVFEAKTAASHVNGGSKAWKNK